MDLNALFLLVGILLFVALCALINSNTPPRSYLIKWITFLGGLFGLIAAGSILFDAFWKFLK